MATMKAVVVRRPGGPFEMTDLERPLPGYGEVRIRVAACGICHADALIKEGHWPGLQYPRVPGHEIAGIIDEVGPGVTAWSKGRRVGVGWAGGHCGQCDPCRRGDFVNCRSLLIPGFTRQGGYAHDVIASAGSVAAIPDELSFEEAAPLLCAGVTTFNALRNSGARAGDTVAVQGVGGLGHLGIQFARKMGFRTIALSAGTDKRSLAEKLGAHDFIDTSAGDPAAELTKRGGARVILATAPSGKAIASLVNGLGHLGELVVLGASIEPMPITPLQLIMMKRRIQGWPSGSAIDSEDAMRFAVLAGIRPQVEVFTLDQAETAFQRMITNKVRFRSVLKTGLS